nr:hypothetical protein CFP56_00042 [Quercus suber]
MVSRDTFRHIENGCFALLGPTIVGTFFYAALRRRGEEAVDQKVQAGDEQKVKIDNHQRTFSITPSLSASDKRGQITDREVGDTIWKNLFQRKVDLSRNNKTQALCEFLPCPCIIDIDLFQY